MFLINDNHEIIRFSNDVRRIKCRGKIKSAFINSRDIFFNLCVLPDTSLFNVIKICFHKKEKNVWSRLFLSMLDEICKKQKVRILQEINANNEIIDIAENVCPIELVISKWCYKQTANWWIFCVKNIDNKMYRIVAGYRNGVAISRFVRITNNKDIFQEIYRTILYLRKLGSIGEIDLFSNLDIICNCGLQSDYIKISRFKEIDAFSMLLSFAKKRDIFYPVFKRNKIYFSDRSTLILKNVSISLSVVFFGVVVFNLNKYIDFKSHNEIIKKRIINNEAQINQYFSTRDQRLISKILHVIDSKRNVIGVLKKYSDQIFKINSIRFWIKNNSIFVEINNKLNEDFVKNALRNMDNKKWIMHIPQSKKAGENTILEIKL